MIVLKFGGSSVGNSERIENVIKILKTYKNTPIAVVFSAFQTVTDNLIKLGDLAKSSDEDYQKLLVEVKQKHIDTINKIIPKSKSKKTVQYVNNLFNDLSELLKGVYLLRELTPRTLDYLTSFGERLSCFIISETLNKRGIRSEYLKASDLVKTDSNFTYAKVDFEKTNNNIKSYFRKHKDKTQIITGFIASNDEGDITTLGRGGSDYTASIFGAALNADEIQIWTDVDGILTADPRKVEDSFPLKAVTYEEAMELSHFGAKVIHPPTMLPALQSKIKIRIKNTFNPEYPGTVILKRDASVKFNLKGISSIDDIALLTIKGGGMVGVTGIASRLFTSLAEVDINIILISQGSSEHSICLAILPKHTSAAKKVIEKEFKNEIQDGKITEVQVENNMSIIAVVGEDLRQTPGITGKVFDALGSRNINVDAIAHGSSMLNLSLVVAKEDLKESLNALHESLFLKKKKVINLFLVGPGTVGGSLLNIIAKQLDSFSNDHKIEFKLIGLADIDKMIINSDGINIKNWKQNLSISRTKTDIDKYLKAMTDINLPNSILVDSTPVDIITKKYSDILNAGISIVTPNKIANSDLYKNYLKIREAASKGNSQFRYETNVGAALPVVESLQNLVRNGDEIIKIEGVLSGTLSYIFNSLKVGKKFSEVVIDAKKRGFTEPDPRDDLSGLDIVRKLLILVRESGIQLELNDIEVDNLVPKKLRNLKDVDQYLSKLSQYDDDFEKMRVDAEKDQKVLSYIAKYENGKATVKIEAISPDHPFYHLSGIENIVSFTTKYYNEIPLVIKGPGAGPEFTASGVLSDILKIANSKG
ncbi:MAG: bifunctional aspartate kinase/homoserine dehydrogenase I [Bacteroidota bacterium]